MNDRDKAMLVNATIFDRFCRDVEAIGGKVRVGLSGSGVAPDEGPPHDLVVHVVKRSPGRDNVRLAERVTGAMADTIVLLRKQLGMVAA